MMASKQNTESDKWHLTSMKWYEALVLLVYIIYILKTPVAHLFFMDPMAR